MGKYFTFILLLFSTTCFGFQNKLDQDKIRFGVSTNYIGNLNFYKADGFMFNTSFDAKIKNQVISVSPLFFIVNYNQTSFLRGGLLSYKYFPNKPSKHFNLYLSADLLYTYNKDSWSKYAQFSTDFVFYHIDFKSRWNSLKALVGYGLTYNISKKLFVSSDMSIGIDFYNYSNETIVKEKPEYSNKNSSGSIFKYSKVTSIFKIGIGYEF